MTAKEIMTQGVSTFKGNTAIRFGTDKQSNTKNSFEMIMNKSLNSSNQNQKQPITKQNSLETKSKQTDNSVQNTQNVQDVSKVQSKDVNVQHLTNNATDVEVTEPVKEETVAMLEKEIGEVVKDILDITDEELENLLSILNVGLIDLCNPDMMRNLVLEANQSTDFTDLLLNENMENQLNQLFSSLEPTVLAQQLDIPKEQLQQIVDLVSMPAVEEETSAAANPFTDIKELETQNTQSTAVQSDLSQKQIDPKTVKVSAEEDIVSEEQTQDPKIVVVKPEETVKEFSQSQTTSQDQNAQDQKSENRDSSIETFINNLVGTQTNNKVEFNEQIIQVQQMREIVQQVVEQIKVVIKPDQTQMQMQLNPEHLGKLQLSVTAKDGVMTASFVVQNEVAKEAIESQMQTLQDRFQEQGLKVEAVEVTVSNFTFEQSNQTDSNNQEQKGKQRRHLNLEDVEEVQHTLTEEEEIAVDMMAKNGGSIDYTA